MLSQNFNVDIKLLRAIFLCSLFFKVKSNRMNKVATGHSLKFSGGNVSPWNVIAKHSLLIAIEQY